jgi:hypothetical protein
LPIIDLDFHILGPVEVVVAAGPIPLGGPKQRAVLAILLLQANQVVPVDQIADDLYGGDARRPRSPRYGTTCRSCAGWSSCTALTGWEARCSRRARPDTCSGLRRSSSTRFASSVSGCGRSRTKLPQRDRASLASPEHRVVVVAAQTDRGRICGGGRVIRRAFFEDRDPSAVIRCRSSRT